MYTFKFIKKLNLSLKNDSFPFQIQMKKIGSTKKNEEDW